MFNLIVDLEGIPTRASENADHCGKRLEFVGFSEHLDAPLGLGLPKAPNLG